MRSDDNNDASGLGAGFTFLQLSLFTAASSLVVFLRHRKQHLRREHALPSPPITESPGKKTKASPSTPRHAGQTMRPVSASSPVAPSPCTPCLPRHSGRHASKHSRHVSRCLSTGPERDVQDRVSHALDTCPGMEEVGRRRIELLVHNVSHKDMVLSLATLPGLGPSRTPSEELLGRTSSTSSTVLRVGPLAPFTATHRRRTSSSAVMQEDLVLCRPKFSLFQPVSDAILQVVHHHICPSVKVPVYVREHNPSAPAALPGPTPSSASSSDAPSLRRGDMRHERSYILRRQSLTTQPELPVGFDLSECPLPVQDLTDFRLRRDDLGKLYPPLPSPRLQPPHPSPGGHDPAVTENVGGMAAAKNDSVDRDPLAGRSSPRSPAPLQDAVGIDGVYFPLLANVLPTWRKTVAAGVGPGGEEEVFKIIFLVSGVGMPRDPTSSREGNSTQGTAALLEEWMQRNYPDVRVVRVHSTTNIFRYDENIAFVKNELLPLIEHYRDGAAERWGTSWRHKYRLTISFADGSPARISAINAALRPYRPSFMHTWELKTFWHHAKMCLEDVEVLAFEDIDTAPPVPLSHADARARLVAQEMLRYKEEVLLHYRQGLCADLSTFWLRKTEKPVLAVLLVQKDRAPPLLYRGCNMEVSMPTGSLCAERNAIGSALAADLTLKRRDLKVVAVLSVSFGKNGNAGGGVGGRDGGRKPEGTAKALDAVFASIDTAPRVASQTTDRNHSYSDSCTGHSIGNAQPRGLLGPRKGDAGASERTGGSMMASVGDQEGPWTPSSRRTGAQEEVFDGLSPPRTTIIRSYSVKDLNGCEQDGAFGKPSPAECRGRPHASSMDSLDPKSSTSTSPIIPLSNLRVDGGGRDQQGPGAMTIRVEADDLNPLKPCGACMEWLKKIAEKNPEFRVATFTDEACRGIYTEFVSTTST